MEENYNKIDQEKVAIHKELSLSKLPTSNYEDIKHFSTDEPSHYFEFFTNLDYQMSPADDALKGFHRRRCESFPDRSSTTTAKRVMRSSRSLDYKKPRRHSSLRFETSSPDTVVRAFSDKSSEKSRDHANNRSYAFSKPPRWYYVMTFGQVKIPRELDLHDIKTRQLRRRPGITAQSPVDRKVRKFSWDLLSMLSCKNHASVAVVASRVGRVTH